LPLGLDPNVSYPERRETLEAAAALCSSRLFDDFADLPVSTPFVIVDPSPGKIDSLPSPLTNWGTRGISGLELFKRHLTKMHMEVHFAGRKCAGQY
jgi:hypothetical protein